MGRRGPNQDGKAYGGEQAPNLQMRRFAELYNGDGKAAAIAAGYAEGSAAVTAHKLLGDPRIKALIDEREKKRVEPHIKSAAELRKWWSDLMDNPETSEQGRLKASELLARSRGLFLDRAEVEHKVTPVLPPGLDTETLVFIARGGLRATSLAPTAPALPEGDDVDDDSAPDDTPH